MDYAARLNSLLFADGRLGVPEALRRLAAIDGLTHAELNYPEHLEGLGPGEAREALGRLRLNGLAVRWRREWLAGDFTNPSAALRARAVELACEAADACRELGGRVLTLWLESDGFDYPFQLDYARAFAQVAEAVRAVCDHAPDLLVSVEYKPFEEREFALVDSMGMTLYLLDRVERPNVGCTLDFCHMLMKHDSPALGLDLAAASGRLFGVHANDGYGLKDSGLVFGSVNFALAAEFVYYLERSGYDGVVYFDTFPVREDPEREIRANLEAFELIRKKIAAVGPAELARLVAAQDGIRSVEAVTRLLKA